MAALQQLLLSYPTSSGSSSAQWDTSYYPSNITYSNSNRTVENTSNIDPRTTRTTTSRNSGKVYVEFTLDKVLTSYPAIALGNASTAMDNYPGADTNSIAWFWDDGLWYNEDYTAYTAPSAAEGNRLCLALNFDDELLFGRINNGTWWGSTSSANPAANTNGHDFSGIGGPYYLLCCGRYSSSNGFGSKSTTSFSSADWLYSAPSGYGEW